MTNKIDDYLKDYLFDEYGISDSFKSNGDIENQFSQMTKKLQKQDIIIKLLSNQKDTAYKSGIFKYLTEFQNTLWRFLVGDPEAIYRNYVKSTQNPHLRAQFEKFCLKVREDASPIDFPMPGKLFIDVTNTCQREKITGIQRVVFEISRGLLNDNTYLVLLTHDGMFAYNKLSGVEQNMTFSSGDIFLMPEVGIDHCHLLSEAMVKNKRAGGKNVSIVYDLIPINYPLTCAPAVSFKFHRWLMNCAFESDLVLSNTKAVASQIRKIADERPGAITGSLIVDFFRLGSELPLVDPETTPSKTKRFSYPTENIFLSVGTIEPRKGYAISLDAADMAWLDGADFIYIIVGRYGWSQTKLRERILSHDLYGEKLIWLEDIDDTELAELYEMSKYLIFSSIDEGFGLPLVEASQHKLPAIASDIPVFREIAGDGARYFEAANPDELAKEIIRGCGQPKMTTNIERIYWAASINELIDKISNK